MPESTKAIYIRNYPCQDATLTIIDHGQTMVECALHHGQLWFSTFVTIVINLIHSPWSTISIKPWLTTVDHALTMVENYCTLIG